MNTSGDGSVSEKKTKNKSSGWFSFTRSKKKCISLYRIWSLGTPVEVSKPRNFQSVNHVEIDPNSELGIKI